MQFSVLNLSCYTSMYFVINCKLVNFRIQMLVSTCCVCFVIVVLLVLRCSQLNSSEGAIQQAKADLPLPLLKTFS